MASMMKEQKDSEWAGEKTDDDILAGELPADLTLPSNVAGSARPSSDDSDRDESGLISSWTKHQFGGQSVRLTATSCHC